jgi:protein Mpv17
MGMMEGRDPKHIRARFEDIFRPALLANWKIWPAAQVRQVLTFRISRVLLTGEWWVCGRDQFINFRFMPLPYRVPFQQTCGVFWTLYLSLLNAASVFVLVICIDSYSC